LRQSAQKVDETVSWKQEVTRRVAEHKERALSATTEEQTNADGHHAVNSRAAATAARVAARYAKAPSYSEMLAEEARAAVRAAEAASKAALEAQAAAESVLAGLEAASAPAQVWKTEFFTAAVPEPVKEPVRERVKTPAVETTRNAAPVRETAPATQAPPPSSSRPSFEIRWDADMPVRDTGPAVARASHGASIFETQTESSRQTARDARSLVGTDGVEVVEAAQPIHANLIEFPRELVATRKIRPRRAEGPYAASMEEQGQLSIFEVEPWTISTEPAATGAAVEAGTAAWVGPKWSGIELEEETREEMASPAAEPAGEQRVEPVASAAAFQPAPLNQRLMAAVVDFSLVSGAFLAAALVATANARALPAIEVIELESVAALVLIGGLYLIFFLILAGATPGMKYAHLEMRTLAGMKPHVTQRFVRVGAMVLSLLPLGLGGIMGLFDEQRLSWHDRLSKTYLRKR
jgi:uncharacterized RDD family membrane protein YckC